MICDNMDLKNQNMFRNEQMKFNQNPVLTNTVANLKAMSLDPNQKNQALSTLARFQSQMNPSDYNEILTNIKSTKTLDSKQPLSQKAITEQDYRSAVNQLHQLEREMRKQ